MFKNKPTDAAWQKMEWVISHNQTENAEKTEWGYIVDWNDNISGIVRYYLYYDVDKNQVVSSVLNTRNYWEV